VIDNRTQVRKDAAAGIIVKRGIPTGYKEIDANLYHNGWGRQELSVMMGAAKAGKSLSLGDFTKNASILGYNTAYFSLEVSHRIISDRLDAAISDTMISKLHLTPDDVAKKVAAMSANAGALIMRDYGSGTLKPSVLHRCIEKLRQEGIVLDLITVDYADIMAAEYRSDKLQDNLREIYIDLRAIAHDFDAAMLTATQTNRDGAKAMTAKATDVGDDWNKVRTADVLIGINASEAEKKAGEARLYWAISRNTEDGFSLRIKQDRSKMQFLTKVIGRE
jgi:replicative DNA helicase